MCKIYDQFLAVEWSTVVTQMLVSTDLTNGHEEQII